jgi:LacI family transcriptional regulator, galactose operon repressor
MARKTSRKSGKAVTIHDVARHAGVSTMTVSRVINARANVLNETRERVQASIKALRFSPNQAARTLASADTMQVGVLYSNPSAAYLSEFLLGSLDQARQSGVQLVLEQCKGVGSEREAILRLGKTGINGVILPPPHSDSEAALKAADEAGLPVVLVASGRPSPAHCAVSINDFEAARAMTLHLVGLGHKRIGFINGHPNQTASGQRFRGFIEGMTEAGLSVGSEQVAQGFFTYRSGLAAAQRLLDEYAPTAIFASNDDMAAATMAVAHRKGLDVPGDVAVVGFDDTPVAITVWPELTTVRQPIAEMARESVRLLIDQIRGRRAGKSLKIQHRLLKFSLIKRESSAAAAKPPKRK